MSTSEQHMLRRGVACMILSSVAVCLGQLCWKLAVDGRWPLLLLGFGLYGMGALIMLCAYRFGKLSVLQPILSLNYVLSSLLGTLVLHEAFSFQKGLGVAVIIGGVIILCGGGD